MDPSGGPSAPSDAEALEEFVATQPSLSVHLETWRRAARSAAPVLLLGEEGSGRSTLARALHLASGRDPRVESDVGLIQPTLFEGELFGYLRGAFTGAEAARDGLVARAEGGTLVLDRIEELPTTLQPKLLRLLSESRYTPLGGRERTCDVRFVSIGSPELPDRARSGVFRADLFYRLEVLSVQLPPLRARREDLDTLVPHLLQQASSRYGRQAAELTRGTWSWMREHAWPGNLRELRNCIERAVVLHEGGELAIEAPRGRGRPRSLAEVEEEAIRAALAHTRGHQGRAAEILGISRKTLWEKRKKYGIR